MYKFKTYSSLIRNIVLCGVFVAVFSSVTSAMEFSFKSGELVMKGEIRRGDFDRFRVFLRTNLKQYLGFVNLSSNGGDLVEAVKIARLLRRMYARITVPAGTDCVSSCFFLFVSGIERDALGRVGVHRAFFSRTYFSNLPLAEAEKRQTELTEVVNTVLKANSVPQSIVDAMNKTSSADVYWLSSEELAALGRRPSWYEEFLIAKCPKYMTTERKAEALKKKAKQNPESGGLEGFVMRLDNVLNNSACESVLLLNEHSRLQRLLDASNFLERDRQSKPTAKARIRRKKIR